MNPNLQDCWCNPNRPKRRGLQCLRLSWFDTKVQYPLHATINETSTNQWNRWIKRAISQTNKQASVSEMNSIDWMNRCKFVAFTNQLMQYRPCIQSSNWQALLVATSMAIPCKPWTRQSMEQQVHCHEKEWLIHRLNSYPFLLNKPMKQQWSIKYPNKLIHKSLSSTLLPKQFLSIDRVLIRWELDLIRYTNSKSSRIPMNQHDDNHREAKPFWIDGWIDRINGWMQPNELNEMMSVEMNRINHSMNGWIHGNKHFFGPLIYLSFVYHFI